MRLLGMLNQVGSEPKMIKNNFSVCLLGMLIC